MKPTRLATESRWLAGALYALLGTVAVFLVLVPLRPDVAKLIMAKFHLASPSFARWALLQPIPNMYNFENTIQVEAGPSPVWWVNHYPLQLVTEPRHRRTYTARFHEPFALKLRSTYLGVEFATDYLLTADSAANTIRLERLPADRLPVHRLPTEPHAAE